MMGAIGLDVSILEEPRWTGVERGAAGLVRALGRLAHGPRFLLYSRRPVRWPFPLTRRTLARPVGGPHAFAIWRETRLLSALRRDRVSALYSPVAAIPLLTKVPRIATVHEMPWLRHPGIEGRTRERVHRARIRIAARTAARILVPSETVAGDLRSLCPHASERIKVLSFGVDEYFRPLADGRWKEQLRSRYSLPDGPLVLFVGKARARKNLPVLFDAFTRHRSAVESAPTLLLAGVAPGECPSTEGVHPLGFVSDEDLVRLYNLATALVYPSLSEGFGFPPLEAMSCGTPVVATNAGAVPEVLRDAALLVAPESASGLAAALSRLGNEPELRRSLVIRGRLRAKEFGWPRSAERALDLMAAVAT